MALEHGFDPFFYTKGAEGIGTGAPMVYDNGEIAGGATCGLATQPRGAQVTHAPALFPAPPPPAPLQLPPPPAWLSWSKTSDDLRASWCGIMLMASAIPCPKLPARRKRPRLSPICREIALIPVLIHPACLRGDRAGTLPNGYHPTRRHLVLCLAAADDGPVPTRRKTPPQTPCCANRFESSDLNRIDCPKRRSAAQLTRPCHHTGRLNPKIRNAAG